MPHKKKRLHELTMSDFVTVVPFDQIKAVMLAEDYKKFTHWLRGQTVAYDGAYPCDLRQFIEMGGSKAPVKD